MIRRDTVWLIAAILGFYLGLWVADFIYWLIHSL
jgi:hypothetical protein